MGIFTNEGFKTHVIFGQVGAKTHGNYSKFEPTKQQSVKVIDQNKKKIKYNNSHDETTTETKKKLFNEKNGNENNMGNKSRSKEK